MKSAIYYLLIFTALLLASCTKKDFPPDNVGSPVLYVKGFLDNGTQLDYTIGSGAYIAQTGNTGQASIFRVTNAKDSNQKYIEFYFYNLQDTGTITFKSLEKLQSAQNYDYSYQGRLDSSKKIMLKIVWYNSKGVAYRSDLSTQKNTITVKDVKNVNTENRNYRQITLQTSCQLDNDSTKESFRLNDLNAVIALSADKN